MFQQDGSRAIWAMEFRGYINAKFPGRLVVVEGPTSRIPRYLDINPLDHFVGICEEHCIQNGGKHKREATVGDL
jgi:hypothetical protein